MSAASSRATISLLLCCAGVAALSLRLWTQGSVAIGKVSATPAGIARLVSGDSEHYLAIAAALREGDWSMSHVAPTAGADRAHRQPGYPMLLALAQSLGAEGAPALARVNLVVLVAALWIGFAAARAATGSSPAGLAAAAVLYGAGFLYEIATSRLLTEPLYVAVATAAAGACLAYLRGAGATALLLAAGLGGVAYLVRVNGLFLSVSLALAVVVADLLRARPAQAGLPALRRLPLARYSAALALFAVVTSPSWIPRAVTSGNPVYHGYLYNYLWVDEHERAHLPGPPRYSLATYLSEHDAGDAARRAVHGLHHVFWNTPIAKFGTVVSLALVAALVALLALRDGAGLLIALAGIVQSLPLVWTALSNPARRLPATALLPFTALVIAAAVAALLRRTNPPRG